MVIWIVATLVAFFIKGLCGFANTLVFTSILGFGVSNVNISPVELILGFPSNVILTWNNRKNLKLSIFLPMILIVILGSIPGAFLLKNIDARNIKILFGAVVILVGIEMMLKEQGRIHLKESRTIMGIAGLLGGLMCGLFGVGVLMAACVSRMTDNSDEFKANLSIIFIVENIVRMITYGTLGVITPDTFGKVLILLPFMLIGVFAGIKSSRILNEKTVKKMVIILLILSGFALIAKSL